MRVEHYAQFVVRSHALSPDEIRHRLGMSPDAVQVKGSRHTGAPPIPPTHTWSIQSDLGRLAPSRSRDEPWIPLSAQVDQIVDRLMPIEEALKELCSVNQTSCTLELVRYYYEDPADEANLGLHLNSRVLRFLHNVGAEIDVDEYDLAVFETESQPADPD